VKLVIVRINPNPKASLRQLLGTGVLEINKALLPNGNVTSIIRPKGRFHECALAYSPDDFAKKLHSSVCDLLVRHGFGVEPVEVSRYPAAPVSGFGEFG
jgi:hypothetical protein